MRLWIEIQFYPTPFYQNFYLTGRQNHSIRESSHVLKLGFSWFADSECYILFFVGFDFQYPTFTIRIKIPLLVERIRHSEIEPNLFFGSLIPFFSKTKRLTAMIAQQHHVLLESTDKIIPHNTYYFLQPYVGNRPCTPLRINADLPQNHFDSNSRGKITAFSTSIWAFFFDNGRRFHAFKP